METDNAIEVLEAVEKWLIERENGNKMKIHSKPRLQQVLTEKLDAAAYEYAVKHSSAPDKETPDWIIADFQAGAMWALNLLEK